MNKHLIELCEFLQEYAEGHPGCTKSQIADATVERFSLTRRSVYFNNHFSLYFSSLKASGFSNCVRSLSTLRKFDDKPFVVCAVRPTGIQLMLANSTLLSKISHSSHRLRVDNVRGTFLGTDIMQEYSGLENSPKNFDSLFDLHAQFSWEENLSRLVESTTLIVPAGRRFEPTQQEIRNILRAPELARRYSTDAEYLQIAQNLTAIVDENREEIIRAANIDGSKARGDRLEQIITKAGNFNSLHDVSFTLSTGIAVNVDIKTKVLNYSSSPKAYNIEKMLQSFSESESVFSFFFVGIDIIRNSVVTQLVSILDESILDATRVQFHWAGRNSRGVTQLTGDINFLFDANFAEEINIQKAEAFLKDLIDLPIANQ